MVYPGVSPPCSCLSFSGTSNQVAQVSTVYCKLQKLLFSSEKQTRLVVTKQSWLLPRRQMECDSAGKKGVKNSHWEIRLLVRVWLFGLLLFGFCSTLSLLRGQLPGEKKSKRKGEHQSETYTYTTRHTESVSHLVL